MTPEELLMLGLLILSGSTIIYILYTLGKPWSKEEK